MQAVVLTIHTILVLALVGVVLLQRSEGGALGIGGGGGGGFMSGRGAANALTRTTTVLAALFFATSMGLALMADRGVSQSDIVRSVTGDDAVGEQGEPEFTGQDLLDTLGNTAPAAPDAAAEEAVPDPLIDAGTAPAQESDDEPEK